VLVVVREPQQRVFSLRIILLTRENARFLCASAPVGLVFHNPSNNGVFIGGGQIGFNYQFSNIVLGVESDFDWAGNNNNTGNGIVVPGINGIVQVTSSNRWVTTVAARFGVTSDYWLFYGKAGGGWVGTNDFTVTNVTTGASITAPSNNTNSGWLVGVGIEWAFAPNWSAKFEYDHLGLNSRTFTVPGGGFLAGDTFTISNPNVQTDQLWGRQVLIAESCTNPHFTMDAPPADARS
jgi:outer membrane immunogenic protein